MNIEANLKHKLEIYAVVLESASRDVKNSMHQQAARQRLW
jgi:hypothetical protein